MASRRRAAQQRRRLGGAAIDTPFVFHLVDDVVSTPAVDLRAVHAPHVDQMTVYTHATPSMSTAQSAGGFTAELIVCRAMSEALCDLMFRLV